MVSLLQRRRAMMLQASTPTPPIVCPYITDGLIFWLDGINQGAGSGTWTDLIGGKEFELSGCTKNANGVAFSGSSSYARYKGALSSDYTTETLEIAYSPASTGTEVCFVCPIKTSPVGIGFITNANGQYWMLNLDGVRNSIRWYGGTITNATRISISKNNCIKNGTAESKSGSDSWGGNTTEYSYIGARVTSGALSKVYKGTIHSIRIYSRLLTADEMLANQAVDVTRFGL